MERQLLERMIGAVVLLVALVLIVPAILDGGSDNDGGGDASPSVAESGRQSAADDVPTRRYEIRLDQPAEAPPLPQPSIANDEPPAQLVKDSAATELPVRESTVKRSSPPAKPLQQAQPSNPPPAKVAPAPAKVAPAPAKVAPAPAKPAPVAKPKKVVVVETGWIVQLGSFSNRSNAQGLADRVKANGFAAYLTPVKRSGKTLYRVRVGPSQPSRDKAAKLADDLRRAGYTGQVAEQVAGG